MSGHRKSSRKQVMSTFGGNEAEFDGQKRKSKTPPIRADVTRGRIYPKRSLSHALFVRIATELGYRVISTGNGTYVKLEPNADIQRAFIRIANAIIETSSGL